MKLYIKKKYFDLIKAGKKTIDYRDAHITFICEETNEHLVKRVISCCVTDSRYSAYPDVLTKGEDTIQFKLRS